MGRMINKINVFWQAYREDHRERDQHGLLQLPGLRREQRGLPQDGGGQDPPVRGRGLQLAAGSG